MWDFGYWMYQATFTQTNAGGGNVIVDISLGDPYFCEVEILSIGPDNYAAVRNIDIILRDTDNDAIAYLFSDNVDNSLIQFPNFGADSDTRLNKERLQLGGTDKLSIEATALAQNETLTVNIRAKLKNKKPGVVTTRSTGTVTTSEAYNEVV